MRRTLILLLLGGASLIAGTAALASDHCDRPMRDWRPRQVVEERVRKLGVEVSRIRTDDGCYKVYGHDLKGKRIEAEFDPATLELIEIEGQDDHDDDSERSGGEKTGGENPKAEGDH